MHARVRVLRAQRDASKPRPPPHIGAEAGTPTQSPGGTCTEGEKPGKGLHIDSPMRQLQTSTTQQPPAATKHTACRTPQPSAPQAPSRHPTPPPRQTKLSRTDAHRRTGTGQNGQTTCQTSERARRHALSPGGKRPREKRDKGLHIGSPTRRPQGKNTQQPPTATAGARARRHTHAQSPTGY